MKGRNTLKKIINIRRKRGFFSIDNANTIFAGRNSYI